MIDKFEREQELLLLKTKIDKVLMVVQAIYGSNVPMRDDAENDGDKAILQCYYDNMRNYLAIDKELKDLRDKNY